MSRIVRLTEADLVRLVKKIVKEEDAFTFGDKLKNTKLGNLVGFHKTTESERELAEKIYQSMVDGNFEFIGKLYSRKPSYRVIVYMRDGDYEVEARTDTNLEGGSSTYTAVKLPNGKMKHIFRKGFTDKLKELIEKSQGFDEDKRVIREEEMSDDLPICSSKMSSGGVETGSSSQMTGIDKITYNSSVSPQYQGYTVHKNGGPFCFIKRS